jgi:hypothetical protein
VPIVETTGVSPSSSRRCSTEARTWATSPTKPSEAIALGHGQQPGILAGDADRDRVVERLAVDRADQVAVDLADQHHADQLERLLVGDAKAVAEFGLLAHPSHQHVDLRPAAMDEDTAHADAAQQQHVLGERAVELLVDRSPTQLHHHRLAGEAVDIGQGLDEDLGGFGSVGHDVFTFSLM